MANGAASGIGAQIAQSLAQTGTRVALIDGDIDAVRSMATQLSEGACQAEAVGGNADIRFADSAAWTPVSLVTGQQGPHERIGHGHQTFDGVAAEFALLDEFLKARAAQGLTQAEVAQRVNDFAALAFSQPKRAVAKFHRTRARWLARRLSQVSGWPSWRVQLPSARWSTQPLLGTHRWRCK